MANKSASKTFHAITISGPMVILPADEYTELITEAGYRDVPELELEVAEADRRYRQGQAIPWSQFKSEIEEI